MQIKDQWDRLDSETQQWFLDNPGCVILPRTLVAVIRASTNGENQEDRHGEVALSQEDQDFIRSKARRLPADPAGPAAGADLPAPAPH